MKSFYLIILCLSSVTCLSQKDGYEVIKMGKNFFDKTIADAFKLQFSTGDSLVFRVEGKRAKKICDEGVDYLDVAINPDSTVKKIELYTIGKHYPDGNDFLNNYKSISQCMVKVFGKPDYFDDGKNKTDGLMTATWLLPEFKTMFTLYTYSLPVQLNTVMRLYKMVWTVYSPTAPIQNW